MATDFKTLVSKRLLNLLQPYLNEATISLESEGFCSHSITSMQFRFWANQFQSYMNDHPRMARGLSCVWVLGLGFVVYLWHLGSVGLVDETEPLFAEAARQMTVTGDWITPMFNGVPRFDKPPLIYWLMAIGYKTIGVNEWAARLPSALSAIALVSVVFWVLLHFAPIPPSSQTQPLDEVQDVPIPVLTTPKLSAQNWIAAWVGAAVMCLHPLTLIWARTGVSDMLLSACVGIAILAFYMGYAQPEYPQRQTRWYLMFYAMMALAVLTKGPIGLVIPVLTLGLFSLYLGNWRKLLGEIRLLPGLLLTGVISVPWFLAVTQQNGQAYISSFFGYHNVERFVSVVNRHSAPWYFYFVVVLLGFLPWSTFLPAAIAKLQLAKRRFWQHQPRTHHLGLLACAWFVSVFGFFSISVTKLPSYVLPLMPAAAILVTLLWNDALHTNRFGRLLRWTSLGQIGLLTLYTITFWVLPQVLGPDPAAPMLIEDLQAQGIFWGSTLIWGIATLASLLCVLRRSLVGLWLVHAIAFLIFVISILHPLAFVIDTHRQLPLRQIAQVVQQQRQDHETILMLGFKKPTLVFYSHQNMNFHWDGNEYFSDWSQTPQTPSFLVITSEKSWKKINLDDYPAKAQVITQQGTYQLLRITAPSQ